MFGWHRCRTCAEWLLGDEAFIQAHEEICAEGWTASHRLSKVSHSGRTDQPHEGGTMLDRSIQRKARHAALDSLLTTLLAQLDEAADDTYDDVLAAVGDAEGGYVDDAIDFHDAIARAISLQVTQTITNAKNAS